jgi:thioredoxin reductase
VEVSSAAAHFDAIVLGAGQAGPPLAVDLAKAGQKVALIERKNFGGTCVNTGCIPTKTLLANARVAYMARRGGDYGVSTGAVAVDMKKVKARKDEVPGPRDGVEKMLRTAKNCTVHTGHARFVADRAIEIDGKRLTADRIFINVGGRAAIPQIDGLESVAYLTNSSMMDVDFLPQHLVIVGGSYVAIEFAQMYRRFGSRVTILQRGPRLVTREDEDVSKAMLDLLVEEQIDVRLDVEQIAVRKSGAGTVVEATARDGKSDCRLAPAARYGQDAEYRRSGPGKYVDQARRTRVRRRRRFAADQCGRRLGARRLQRPWRVHAYVVQRLRNRRRQSVAPGIAPRDRPHRHLCGLHRPAAGARRHDRGGYPQGEKTRPGRHAADGTRRPRARARRNPGSSCSMSVTAN